MAPIDIPDNLLSRLLIGGRVLLIGQKEFLLNAAEKVLSLLTSPDRPAGTQIIVMDCAPDLVWSVVRRIRFNGDSDIARSPIHIQRLNTECPDYGKGTSSFSPSNFLCSSIRSFAENGTLTEHELRNVRATFAGSVPQAIKQKIVFLWHDLRNDCLLLLDSWELLIDDPEDSLAFSATGEDPFAVLAMKSAKVSNVAGDLYSLINLWFPGRNLGPHRQAITRVFTDNPCDSSVLSLFSKYPSPRSPVQGSPSAVQRYRDLVDALTSTDLVMVANELRVSLSAFESAVNECVRGSLILGVKIR